MCSDKDIERFDALLEDLFPAGEGPDPGAEDRAVSAVEAAFGRGRTRHPVWRAAAAAALLAVGIAVGYVVRGSGGADGEVLPSSLADHERTVFAAVRESLGEKLSWIASEGGEVLVGLSATDTRTPLRVIFVETRDGTGALLARTRVVLPEGDPIHVAFPESPALTLGLTRRTGDEVVRCSVEFPDGARIESPGARVEIGRRTLLGQVRTDGRTVSVYVAAF